MKTKKFFMLLAAMLLSSASAFAQSGNNEPLKGDVNGDGKVDVADIAAVIEIMKNGGGTGEQTTYYWYIGGIKQDNMENDPDVLPVDDVTSTGWRKITQEANQYTRVNPLFDAIHHPIDLIQDRTNDAPSYIYFPKSYVDAGLWMYDDDGDRLTVYRNIDERTITINNIVYNEYKRSGYIHDVFNGILIYIKR